MLKAECIECGAELSIESNAIEGEIIVCDECGAELEIISLKPLKLDLAPTEMEDWGE
jgi:alpha-aminoadipate carrier protein LysW